MVAITLPLKGQPSNGVFLPLETKSRLSPVHSLFGLKMVTSARQPGFNVPSSPYLVPIIIAGSNVSLEIRVFRSSCPLCTRPIRQAKAVYSPLLPKAASPNSHILSTEVCGARSEERRVGKE